MINTKDNENNYLYFIHIPKTAGTYITRILEKNLGDRFVREGHCASESNLFAWTDRGWGPHACFTNVNRENCLTFSIIRNPFDLLVSMYLFGFPYWAPKWASQHKRIDWPFKSFRDYIYKLCNWDDYPWICPPQKESLFFQLYDNRKEFHVDYLVRQEMLEPGMTQLLDIFGRPVDMPKARINVTNTRKKYTYKDFYDAELIDLVTQHYHSDLNRFGYVYSGHEKKALIDVREICQINIDDNDKSNIIEDSFDSTFDTAGELADRDMHPWGSEVLSQFTARQLGFELVHRIGKRVIK